MKILEWYDSVVTYFLYTLSQIGGGSGNGVTLEIFAKENLPEWVMWLARIMLGLVFILASFACWRLIGLM
jgi:hypothetical protein